MMSRADTPKLMSMTQQAIYTAVDGAEPGALNIVVMEQQPGVAYRDAKTITAPEDFNYNRFANVGAALGHADWVVVANNDLLFAPGWLTALLEVDCPVVSPIDPGNARQRQITRDTAGQVTGVHLSGWCFMIARELLDKIGGLDERLSFWCSDDALIQQLLAVGVLPVVTPQAKVHHLVSATLHTRDDQDELTWGQVEVFNELYGCDLGANNPRFLAWVARRQRA
jgi:hypothetical protein